MNDPEYVIFRLTAWVNVQEAHISCIELEPTKRQSLSGLINILFPFDKSESFPIILHQGSALVDCQEKHLKNSSSGQSERPLNDGTSAYPFLSLKIVEIIFLNESVDVAKMKIMIEPIIDEFPLKINSLRDIEHLYTVNETYHILHNADFFKFLNFHIKQSSTMANASS